MLPISTETKHIPERLRSSAEKLLVFQSKLPALGIATYFVQEDVVLRSEGNTDWTFDNLK